jgi:hypothetical protein
MKLVKIAALVLAAAFAASCCPQQPAAPAPTYTAPAK